MSLQNLDVRGLVKETGQEIAVQELEERIENWIASINPEELRDESSWRGFLFKNLLRIPPNLRSAGLTTIATVIRTRQEIPAPLRITISAFLLAVAPGIQEALKNQGVKLRRVERLADREWNRMSPEDRRLALERQRQEFEESQRSKAGAGGDGGAGGEPPVPPGPPSGGPPDEPPPPPPPPPDSPDEEESGPEQVPLSPEQGRALAAFQLLYEAQKEDLVEVMSDERETYAKALDAVKNRQDMVLHLFPEVSEEQYRGLFDALQQARDKRAWLPDPPTFRRTAGRAIAVLLTVLAVIAFPVALLAESILLPVLLVAIPVLYWSGVAGRLWQEMPARIATVLTVVVLPVASVLWGIEDAPLRKDEGGAVAIILIAALGLYWVGTVAYLVREGRLRFGGGSPNVNEAAVPQTPPGPPDEEISRVLHENFQRFHPFMATASLFGEPYKDGLGTVKEVADKFWDMVDNFVSSSTRRRFWTTLATAALLLLSTVGVVFLVGLAWYAVFGGLVIASALYMIWASHPEHGMMVPVWQEVPNAGLLRELEATFWYGFEYSFVWTVGVVAVVSVLALFVPRVFTPIVDGFLARVANVFGGGPAGVLARDGVTWIRQRLVKSTVEDRSTFSTVNEDTYEQELKVRRSDSVGRLTHLAIVIEIIGLAAFTVASLVMLGRIALYLVWAKLLPIDTVHMLAFFLSILGTVTFALIALNPEMARLAAGRVPFPDKVEMVKKLLKWLEYPALAAVALVFLFPLLIAGAGAVVRGVQALDLDRREEVVVATTPVIVAPPVVLAPLPEPRHTCVIPEPLEGVLPVYCAWRCELLPDVCKGAIPINP